MSANARGDQGCRYRCRASLGRHRTAATQDCLETRQVLPLGTIAPSGSASLTTNEETIQKEEDYCANHTTDETGGLSGLIPADRLAQIGRGECADNSQDGGQNKALWLTLVARHDELGNHANDEPNDNRPKNAHIVAPCTSHTPGIHHAVPAKLF